MPSIKKHLFAFFSIASLFIMLTLCHAEEIDENRMGLHLLEGVSRTDWVEFNSAGNKVAVVETVLSAEFPALGKALKIYEVDPYCQIQKTIFEIKSDGTWITEFQWVGDSIFYTTIEGFDKSDQVWEWFTGLRQSTDFDSIPKRLKLRAWPSSLIKNDLEDIYLFGPGESKLFALDNERLLLIDPLFAKQETRPQLESSYSNKKIFKIFSIPQGKLISSFPALIPSLGGRWWSQNSQFVPLSISHDGRYLIAIATAYFPWRSRPKYDAPFVIAIDTENGQIHEITPDSGLNGLRFLGDHLYFQIGNPMVIKGGKQVVGNLDMTEAGNNLAFRFGYFNMEGKREKEVLIYRKDLELAGASPGLMVTWTLDGEKILIQEGNIWLYDWQNKTSVKIAETVWIEDVMGWIDNRHLLVRAVQPDKERKTPLTDRDVQSHKQWAILSISETAPE